MHEAINAGTINGYLVSGVAKITGVLPTITRACYIACTNQGKLDCSAMENTGSNMVIRVEGSIGAAASLTADANVGDNELSVGTAYADGTLLKVFDPVTQ